MNFASRFARPAVCGATVALALLAASASVVSFDFSGTVGAYGYDTTGVFGTPNTSLEGLPFEAHLLIDLSLGNRSTTAISDELVGGPKAALTMPVLSGTLAVDGVAVPLKLDGHVHMSASESGNGYNSFNLLLDFYEPPLQDDEFVVFLGSPLLYTSLSTPNFVQNINGAGQFQFFTDNPSQAFHDVYARGQLDIKAFRISNVSEVPEPTTAALISLALLIALWRGPRTRNAASTKSTTSKFTRDDSQGHRSVPCEDPTMGLCCSAN